MRYIFKENNTFYSVSNEVLKSFIPLEESTKYVVIDGLIVLYLNWKKKAERLLRKYSLRYGDSVVQKKKTPWGKLLIKRGILIKRDGIPHVKLTKSESGVGIVKWDETWLKK